MSLHLLDADHQAKIALLQSSSLATLVQQDIERSILAGECAPGAKLTEATIAERLGVSRGPVREAFRKLEESGLLRNEKNRGVFVRKLSVEEVQEIFDLRAAMEEWVGRKLARSATPAQTKEIKSLIEQMEKAVKASDTRQYHLLNLQFHDRLVEMVGNSKLAAMYRKLIKELSLFRRINLSDTALLPVSVGEHRAIASAIASGDVDAAGQALFDHVIESKERTLVNPLLRERPEPPSAALGIQRRIRKKTDD